MRAIPKANSKPTGHLRPSFDLTKREPEKIRPPMFRFRVVLTGDEPFDVEAARSEDAVAHVKKFSRKRVSRVENLGEAKRHAPVL